MTNYAINKKKPVTTYAEDEKRAIKRRKQARKRYLKVYGKDGLKCLDSCFGRFPIFHMECNNFLHFIN